MTTKEYSVLELCEQVLFVKKQTFKNSQDKYLSKLSENYHVEIIKKRPMIIALTTKGKSPQQVDDTKFLEIIGCDIGGKDITLLKFILKSILERIIVPGQDEIAHHAKQAGIWSTDSRGSVKNYMAFLRENNIIVEPMTIPTWDNNPLVKRVIDKETGEILPTYYKKICNRIYFDYAKDGSSFQRERLPKNTQEAIEMAYYNSLPEMMESKIYPLYAKGHSDKYINNERMKAQDKLLREIGTAYGINYCVRMDEPSINPVIKGKLKEYFGIGV
ncbi:hypothetical protein [Peribacillus sp. NPDC060253]|uniref:hypothetical protein n=1 Tax=Peribacillus sp. NPDC060253 TaxID=3347084 RepID=UPI00365C0140